MPALGGGCRHRRARPAARRSPSATHRPPPAAAARCPPCRARRRDPTRAAATVPASPHLLCSQGAGALRQWCQPCAWPGPSDTALGRLLPGCGATGSLGQSPGASSAGQAWSLPDTGDGRQQLTAMSPAAHAAGQTLCFGGPWSGHEPWPMAFLL